MGSSALNNKIYCFDKVLSPAADQAMVFGAVVTSILGQMLLGYNCTISAYGQTGTCKTYTMSGDTSDIFGLVSNHTGIVSRALHSLFNNVEATELEYDVKFSFIELYNDELRDFLALDDSTKLKIFEGGQKKGQAIVQGMEESHIKSGWGGFLKSWLGRASSKRGGAVT